MFWSLVRPERILPPITRSAAVTTALEADELAVGMITCEDGFKGQDFSPDQRRASALRTAGRFVGLLWAGGGSKKEGAPRPGRGGGRALLNVRTFSWATLLRKTGAGWGVNRLPAPAVWTNRTRR